MINILRFILVIGILAFNITQELYPQDSDLPESWVNPPPDPEDIQTFPFEPNPLKPLVSMGPNGKLVYKPYSDKGDRILDWSKVGYKQSNVPIPNVPVMDTLSPLTGETSPDGNMAYPKGPDSRNMIQTALYNISKMTPNADGVRGALLLKAGTYYIYGSLFIPSGVVLRGEGDDENGTVLIFRSVNGGGDAIQIGQGSIDKFWATTVKITNNYIPSGSYELSVEDASKFAEGDYVYVRKTVNQKWIDDLGCGERLRHIRGGEEGAGKNPWKPESYQFMHLRKIAKVDGNTITLDVMMPQSIADEHGGGEVLKANVSIANNCGVESLCLVSNYDKTVENTGKDANYINFGTGINIKNAMDCWVQNVSAKHMYRSTVCVSDRTLQVTIRDCKYLEPKGPIAGGYRYSFNLSNGTGHLVYNCFSEDSRHDYAGGSRSMGPYAFVKCTAVRGGGSEPHHRWGTGFLFDNVTSKDGAISAFNRGDSGSGHGWAAANTLMWNCDAASIVVFDPETEGENNFAIGYIGDKKEFDSFGIYYPNTRAGYWGTPKEGKYYGHGLMGSGYIESPDAPVDPQSLYIQQLIERIGVNQAMRVLDDDKELESRLGIVDIFSAYPALEKKNDSTFFVKFNKPVNFFHVCPEYFSISGNTGLEEADYSTYVLKDSIVMLRFDGIGALPLFSELIVNVNNVSALTGEALEGITKANYVEPDQRPVVVGEFARVNNVDGTLEASSSKPGSIYLVKYNEDDYSLDQYNRIDELDQSVADNLGKKVDAPVADTPVIISTEGLTGGFYIYYAVDEDGRISEPAYEWPEVEEVVSSVMNRFLISGFTVWSAHGKINIRPDDNSLNYSAQLFDMTGRLIDVGKKMTGDQHFIVHEYHGMLIVKLISENENSAEFYKLLHNQYD